jgi:hypothetical protein
MAESGLHSETAFVDVHPRGVMATGLQPSGMPSSEACVVSGDVCEDDGSTASESSPRHDFDDAGCPSDSEGDAAAAERLALGHSDSKRTSVSSEATVATAAAAAFAAAAAASSLESVSTLTTTVSSASPLPVHLERSASGEEGEEPYEMGCVRASDDVVYRAVLVRSKSKASPSVVSGCVLQSSLWKTFDAHTNEMILTRTGRCLFPLLQVAVEGLDPNGVSHFLQCCPSDRLSSRLHRYIRHGDETSQCG